jgi:hypothetical protein
LFPYAHKSKNQIQNENYISSFNNPEQFFIPFKIAGKIKTQPAQCDSNRIEPID